MNSLPCKWSIYVEIPCWLAIDIIVNGGEVVCTLAYI